MKKQILYVEDNAGTCEAAQFYLERVLLDYEIVIAENGDVVDEMLERGEICLQRLAIVCTDGDLRIGPKGWDVVENLRLREYGGPALYFGKTLLPDEKKDLYNGVSSRKSGSVLVDQIQRLL